MKFFSQLSKEDIHLSDNSKIIPSSDFTKLKKAADILKQVQQEAHEFRKEVAKEQEILKTTASHEGFQEGMDKFSHLLAQMEKELRILKDEFQKKILPIALQAAKKILGEELKLHKDRIVDIVINSLKPVIQHHRIKIYANKDDIEILEKNKNKLKENLEQLESFTLEEREDVEPGGCIIETESGIINAQLENQWRSLETAFRSYMEKNL